MHVASSASGRRKRGRTETRSGVAVAVAVVRCITVTRGDYPCKAHAVARMPPRNGMERGRAGGRCSARASLASRYSCRRANFFFYLKTLALTLCVCVPVLSLED
ncbi:hypothetical protein BDA96_02G402300 [Sorghum bicolor]|uniref:Uncharacterized protein n=1 Tax=Sorghum bicolor TaxID=4558 RepID=A0A921RUG5_SORBI|nr:hypothetical protein BDA96_02G402300 [Sorghum bicolor]